MFPHRHRKLSKGSSVAILEFLCRRSISDEMLHHLICEAVSNAPGANAPSAGFAECLVNPVEFFAGIVCHAIGAASGHNGDPWRFQFVQIPTDAEAHGSALESVTDRAFLSFNVRGTCAVRLPNPGVAHADAEIANHSAAGAEYVFVLPPVRAANRIKALHHSAGVYIRQRHALGLVTVCRADTPVDFLVGEWPAKIVVDFEGGFHQCHRPITRKPAS